MELMDLEITVVVELAMDKTLSIGTSWVIFKIFFRFGNIRVDRINYSFVFGIIISYSQT